jgi:hypothetical protein
MSSEIDRLLEIADENGDGELEYEEFCRRVMRVTKNKIERGRKGGAAWRVSWTIVRPTTLMDNFWSWQTPWLHPRTRLEMPHDRAAPLQLV